MLCVVATATLSSAASPKASATESKPFTIVLDAGHGGKDVGCVGKITNEKTITLDVIKLIGEKIKNRYPEVKVVFTRDRDEYVALDERARRANNAKGDLFVSVHVNSVARKSKGRESVQGASVYTLGLHKSENNLEVAMRENAVMELDDNYTETYAGFDPNSSESYIIFELNQNTHINRSLEFADFTQRQLVNYADRMDKNVRQAGFWVLWATSMPSVLVELDFICNPTQERFLNSEEGKEKCAEAIFRAFNEYYTHIKPAGAMTTGLKQSVSEKKPASPATPAEEIQPDNKLQDIPQIGNSSEPSWHVQVFVTDVPLPASDKGLSQLENPGYYMDGGSYKYYSGSFKTLKDAKKHLNAIKKSFPQAFIIKLQNGQRAN